MDFSIYDNRTPAETGQRLILRDPRVKDGEAILDGTKECAVIVRGAAAKSVQLAMRARAKSKTGKGDLDARVMEDIHEYLCGAAEPLVVRFENVTWNGKDVGDNRDLIREFIASSFPIMGVKKDDDGETVLTESGEAQFEMKNRPWSIQITEFSAEQAAHMGNAGKG